MLSIITTLNHELNTFSTRVKDINLSLNDKKTYYIKQPDTDYPILMNTSLLYNIIIISMGVILDSKMSWIQHIVYVKNKVAK